jgi:hypothetical protein
MVFFLISTTIVDKAVDNYPLTAQNTCIYGRFYKMPVPKAKKYPFKIKALVKQQFRPETICTEYSY